MPPYSYWSTADCYFEPRNGSPMATYVVVLVVFVGVVIKFQSTGTKTFPFLK